MLDMPTSPVILAEVERSKNTRPRFGGEISRDVTFRPSEINVGGVEFFILFILPLPGEEGADLVNGCYNDSIKPIDRGRLRVGRGVGKRFLM